MPLTLRADVPRLISSGASATGFQHTGNTNETTIISFVLPSGSLGLNGFLEVDFLAEVAAANTNTKRLRFKINSTEFANFNMSGATTLTLRETGRLIFNASADNLQLFGPLGAGPGTSAIAKNTAAVDTSADQTCTFTAELSNGTDTLRVVSYRVLAHWRP